MLIFIWNRMFLNPLVVSHSDCLVPSDCLVLLVFKDKSDKAQGGKERASVTLEEICGLEVGQWYEGVAFTLAILCLNQAALLGFDSKDTLQAWDARLRYSLGEGEEFRTLCPELFPKCGNAINLPEWCHIWPPSAVVKSILSRLVHPSRWRVSKYTAVKNKYHAICQTYEKTSKSSKFLEESEARQ